MYLITGGGSGMGAALALELAHQGREVCIVGRHEASLKKVAHQHPHVHHLVLDVTSHDATQQLKSFFEQRSISSLQGLIHNAGCIEPIESLKTLSIENFSAIMQLNLMAPFRITQNLMPYLSGARVLMIGSGAAHFPIQGWSGYCTSKAALHMLTRCYQAELDDPIFACVMPGIVATAMTEKIRQSKTAMNSKQHAFHQQLFDAGHLLNPNTVALFLRWLLLTVSPEEYVAQEWDIYDTSHHQFWLVPPHEVYPLKG
jgi:benzil reductase ((S)-benzoin forming)